MKRDTMKEAGYGYVGKLSGTNGHVFFCVLTGAKEVWFPNKGHASYGFTYKGTDWEFARSFRE